MAEEYLPLFAEKRCLVCGHWRGQHVSSGDDRNDRDMLCPVTVEIAEWFGVQASFTKREE